MKNIEPNPIDNNEEYYGRLRNATIIQQQKEQKFLVAWKKVINRIGSSLSTNHRDVKRSEKIDEATDKRQLIPCRTSIDKCFSYASTGEKLFIAVIYTFYNGVQGDILCRELGYSNIGDIACRLSTEEIELVSELMKNHTGW